MTYNKIISFTDIKAWQEGHQLVVMVYQITKNFPKEELYGLTSQMRRASSSVTSNIAEGFGRFSYKERLRFYFLAQGSLTELKNQILIAKDVGYLITENFDQLVQQSITTHLLLQGLIRSTKVLALQSTSTS